MPFYTLCNIVICFVLKFSNVWTADWALQKLAGFYDIEIEINNAGKYTFEAFMHQPLLI